MNFAVLAPILLTGMVVAQTQPPVAAPPKTASVAIENRILQAEHQIDQANLVEAQAQAQFEQLKTGYQKAEADKAAGNKAIAQATDDAYREAGLSKADYNFDPANFTFTPIPPDTKKK